MRLRLIDWVDFLPCLYLIIRHCLIFFFVLITFVKPSLNLIESLENPCRAYFRGGSYNMRNTVLHNVAADGRFGPSST